MQHYSSSGKIDFLLHSFTCYGQLATLLSPQIVKLKFFILSWHALDKQKIEINNQVRMGARARGAQVQGRRNWGGGGAIPSPHILAD